MATAALLLLADGRFPAGGHAHSGGLEAAVDDGRVLDLESLATFLAGRLATVGRTDAALAAAVVHRWPDVPWDRLEAEARARTAAPALRGSSVALGRQLLRGARRVWSLEAPADLSHPVALGAVAAAAGLTALDTAVLALHHAVTGPAGAAVRLLGLDPVAVQALIAGLPTDAVAAEAAAAGAGPLEELPGAGLLLVDLAAERHARKEARLFAS
ncbi:MAG TPA: urease accessory UreF family protein [Acidimicrobiales bacterium]|nr:urease accessory UreF family protein [Acidimicrobiales bacterium]